MKGDGQAVLDLLGPAALAEIDRLVAEAPPFTAEQRAALAILLRPDRREVGSSGVLHVAEDSTTRHVPGTESEPPASQSTEATVGDARVERVWMTSKETAAYLRVSLVTVHRHLAAGTMRSSQAVPNGRHLIRRDWADEWAINRRSLAQPRVPDGRRCGPRSAS